MDSPPTILGLDSPSSMRALDSPSFILGCGRSAPLRTRRTVGTRRTLNRGACQFTMRWLGPSTHASSPDSLGPIRQGHGACLPISSCG
jgi:hypothetical protein